MIASNVKRAGIAFPMANFRSRKLLNLLHEAPCMASFPHTCIGKLGPLHSNELTWGRGYSYRSPDWAVAAGCPEAHAFIDGVKGGWDKEAKHAEWLRAYVKTQAWLWETGRLKVAA